MNIINIIGLGYIGLPTALMFASKGINVVGTDYNKELVDTLNENRLTFKEDGLDTVFHQAKKNNIVFTTEYVKASVYIVAVPTPYIKETKKIDIKYLISSINSILDICERESIICIESTVSPGTVDKHIRKLIEERGFILGKDIHLVHTPERIIPGNMIYELKNNSRTIGCDDRHIGQEIKQLYSSFCKGDIIITDIKSAEMSKVVENTFRDINIAFANELAKICRADNMDVYEIIKIANMHPRVNILQPGPGVGGHCISVDPWFLVGDYPSLTNLIWEARKIDDSMPEFVLKRISEVMKEEGIKDISKVGIYGLTYKEDVDDLRESPTIQLLECMQVHLSSGIKVYDPFVKDIIFDNQYVNFDEFLESIEILVIMVSHSHIKYNMKEVCNKIILDTKNICNFERTYKL